MKIINILLALLLITTPAFSTEGILGIRGVNSIVPMKVSSPAKAGFIQAYAGSSVPQGWMACDGTAVSNVVYPDLFANIGETWGDGGDGAGPLFSLPDLESSNRYLRSAGGSLSVGDYQDDATDVNNLVNANSAVGGVDGTVDNTSVNMTLTTCDAITGKTSTNAGAGTGYQIASDYQGCAISASLASNAWTQSGTGTATAQVISSTDSETRPTTAVVKYIIKLWDNTVDASVYISPATGTTSGLLSAEAQTIGGVKTFSSTISGSIAGDSGTTSDSTVVRLSGAQTIGGDKTFSDRIGVGTAPGSGTTENEIQTTSSTTSALRVDQQGAGNGLQVYVNHSDASKYVLNLTYASGTALAVAVNGQATFGSSIKLFGNSGDKRPGFFRDLVGAGATCDTGCAAADSSWGFNGNSGTCLKAWDSTTWAPVSCSAGAGAGGGTCFCMGLY